MIDLIDEPTARLGIAAYGVDVDAALAAYTEAGASPGDTLAAVVTDWFFTIPAVRVAEARGAAATWMYRFDFRSPVLGKLGAAHAVEIPFTFDTLDAPDAPNLVGADAPQEVADSMHAAWVRFIRDGEPGWPRYEAHSRTTQIFGGEQDVIDDPRSDRRQLWDGIR